ncbi:hypothetical protein BSKO_12128 [Bryopsis sp. KO-2023]|nr:hypothetical protein BSKO_12128 [Bryopsis sp. KO-2023]
MLSLLTAPGRSRNLCLCFGNGAEVVGIHRRKFPHTCTGHWGRGVAWRRHSAIVRTDRSHPRHRIQTCFISQGRGFGGRDIVCASKSGVSELVGSRDSDRQSSSLSSSFDDFGLSVDELRRLPESFNKDSVFTRGFIAQALKTDLKQGIAGDVEDLRSRRARFGGNRLKEPDPVSFLELFYDALKDFTLIVLLLSGTLSLGLEFTLHNSDDSLQWLEGAAILATVVVVVLVTSTTNYQKECKFRELSSINQDVKVRAMRHGAEIEISTFDVVVGDILYVESGDILQSDGFLFMGDEISVDESHLTGESDEVSKHPLEDPFIFSGSRVLEGFGKMVVTGVGRNSKQGAIADLVASQGSAQNSENGLRNTTVLTEKLEGLAGDIGRVGVMASLVTFLAMSSRFTFETFFVEGAAWDWRFLQDYLEHVITSITVLVVAVPEGLPLAVTLALAFSVQKMMTDNNLVRNLDACETMGSTTTICSDKTGTLTANDLNVKRIWIGNESIDLNGENQLNADGSFAKGCVLFTLLGEAISLNSTASIEADPNTGKPTALGNRTECGLLKFVSGILDVDYLWIRNSRQIVRNYPFSSSRKRMAVLVEDFLDPTDLESGPSTTLHVKGAAEIVLRLCSKKMLDDGTTEHLSLKEKDKLMEEVGRTEAGLRWLCLACRNFAQEDFPCGNGAKSGPKLEALEEDLTLLALIGLSDTIRPEVPEAINQCKRAGVSVKMLTGDNAETAASIATQCGILTQNNFVTVSEDLDVFPENDSDAPLVLEGPQFRKLVTDSQTGSIDEDVFERVWNRMTVMARCSPEDKYVLVKGIRSLSLSNGRSREVIAMTGDGTNDAPALRIADVGFAMASGTPVAREASDILLLDDSFESIVSAMKWGRNIFQSVTKFLQFQLTVNVVAVVTACAGAIWLKESPLSAVQMLWVNLIMDSLASLSLATEPPSDSVLDLEPFNPEESLITPTVLRNIVGQSLFQLSVMYGLVFHSQELLGLDDQHHQFTMVFNAFVQMQLFNQINARKIYGEDLLEGLFENKLFCGIWAGEFILQVLIVQFGGMAFSTVPLTPKEWAICIGLGLLSLPLREALRKDLHH